MPVAINLYLLRQFKSIFSFHLKMLHEFLLFRLFDRHYQISVNSLLA